ncbi:MAG: molecular chaperone Tir [Zymomonas mobilis subsp. pomaceae]|uniref:molecular chaperone Tir n=1 Tax=Zymomonas mobilis TaxID=542 RepID=UPI0039E89B92
MVNQTSNASAYSANCKAVAKVFVETSRNGAEFDQPISMDELVKRTGLSKEDVKKGIADLGDDKILYQGDDQPIAPHAELFAIFDSFWEAWDPADDALTLAKAMIKDSAFPTDPAQISDRMAWEARRLNPAMTYLLDHHFANAHDSDKGAPLIYNLLVKTAETKQFVSNMATN